MTENNDNDSFSEFLRRLSEEAKNYESSNGENNQNSNPFGNLENMFKAFGNNSSSTPQNNNSPSPEDMQSMLNMFLGGMGNSNSNGMPQNSEEISQMIENILNDLQQNFQALGLSQVSGEGADEMMRVLNELFSNIGQQKKNPLEDVDTSNMDDELEKLLKESVSNTMNNNTDSNKDSKDDAEKENNEENSDKVEMRSDESKDDKPSRIALTNVKASFSNNQLIVEGQVPDGFEKGSVKVSTSLENETLTISYNVGEKPHESVVRVRGVKNKDVIAFDKSRSEIKINDGKWTIAVGLIIDSDVSFESDF